MNLKIKDMINTKAVVMYMIPEIPVQALCYSIWQLTLLYVIC